MQALGARGVQRLDVLAVGGLRDEAVLRELTTGNLPHDGQRIDGAAPLDEIARRLTLACRSGIKVAVDGAGWVWPETLRRRPARRRDARLRRPAGGPAAAPHARRAGRWPCGELGVRRAAAARTGLGPGAHRAAGPPARHRPRRGRGPAPGAQAADHRAERQAPGALPVHRAAGAGDRERLRALRPRPPRPGRHPHRRRRAGWTCSPARSQPAAARRQTPESRELPEEDCQALGADVEAP